MSKKPKLVVSGEMNGEADFGFRWARTAKKMTEKFESFERKSKFKGGVSSKPFQMATVTEFKDDGKFEVTINLSKDFKNISQKEGWDLWNEVLAVMDEFEAHCLPQTPQTEDEAKKMKENEPGVLDLGFITKVELKDE